MKKVISLLLAVIVTISLFSISEVSAAGVVVSQVKNLKATNVTQSTISLDWADVSGATGYEVYKYNFNTKKYEEVNVTIKSEIEIKGLLAGCNYIFKARAYKVVSGYVYKGEFSSTIKVTTKPKRPTNLVVSSYTESSVTIKWSAVDKATGYRVYYYNNKTAKYAKLTDVTTTKCKITGLPVATSHKIRLRAYRTVDGKRTYSYLSDTLIIGTRPNAPSNIYASKNESGKVQICFAPVDKVTGYMIYKYNTKTKEYELIKWAKNNVIDLDLDFDDYDFKMKSYYKVDGKNFYSTLSDLFSTRKDGTNPGGNTEQQAWEDEVLVYVNRERANLGLSQLKMTDGLRTAARARAKEMYEAGVLSHTRPDGTSCSTIFIEYNLGVIDPKTGRTLKNWGENIARGQSSPKAVYEAWYGSTGHRENMLRSTFSYIGVGYYKGYWVQLFTS